MEELLETLKKQIKVMLSRLEQLQQDQQLLMHEKKLLHYKHQNAIMQVERMIARLKPLEEKSEP